MDTAQLPSAASALQSLNGFQMPDSQTVLGQAQTKYGVADLATKVGGLRALTSNLTNAIAAVDPSVTGRTSGTLTTEGQRSSLVARERAPVVQQLGTANDALGLAKDESTNAENKSRDEANMIIRDNETKYSRLKDTYDLANSRETAAAQAASESQARAQAQANADREFAAAQQAAKSKGGSAKAASPAETKLAVAQHVGSSLAANTGKDGKVSNETWAAALNDAVSAGFTPREFWQKYGQYVNGKYGSSYAGYNVR
jgi:hypothetical protein